MAPRYFTPSEANELLAEVRPLAQSLVEHRRGCGLAAERRARLTARIAGNGGDLDPQEPSRAGRGVRARVAGGGAGGRRACSGWACS